MILTCEKCHTRYLLASHMLGYEGRRVRCTHCGHEWYQEKEDESSDDSDSGAMQDEDTAPVRSFLDEESEPQSFDESLADDDLGEEEEAEANPFKELLQKMHEEGGEEEEGTDTVFSLSDRAEEEYPPVPEGVMPDSEPSEPVVEKEPMDWSVVAGGVLVILVIALSAVLLIVFHKPVIHALPATASLYKMIGIEVPVQGEGLVFDKVQAVSKPDKSGKDVLFIEGNILNLTKQSKDVPKIEASLRREDGSVADRWVFSAESSKISPEGQISFTTSYSQTIKDVSEVNVRFVLR